MKLTLGLVLCFGFAAVLALTAEEVKEKMRAANSKCQGNQATAVDEEAMRTYLRSRGQAEKPANARHYSMCMSKELELMNDDGTINRERLRERLSSRIQDATKMDEIMNECAEQKENDLATAAHLFKCFMWHAREDRH